MKNFASLIGQKFGKLTIIELHHKEQVYLPSGQKNGFRYFFLCRCECGKNTVVPLNHLRSSHTKSCGCITLKHGNSESRLFKIYTGMKQRCYNMLNEKFANYGSRGIKICDEWLNDFKTFYDWSILNGYRDNLSIDRIDVNGNYCPENCRWVEMSVQQNNRTNNHLLTYNNCTHTISEWSKILNIKRETIKSRLKYNWSVEKILSTPVKK